MKKITQKEKLLKLLRDNPAGINSFGVAREIALQLPVRILELKRAGHEIVSIPKSDGSVDYCLTSEVKKEEEKKIIRWEFEGNKAFPIFG